MGYTQNGSIKSFWPDDAEDEFYIEREATLADIIEGVRSRWGEDVSFDDIIIESEYIHTDCITYDLYDPSDYTNFILVKRKKENA